MDCGDSPSDKVEELPIPDEGILNGTLNPMLKLPYGVRIYLYKKFNNPLRKALRLVSVDLCKDIDTKIGPVDLLLLKKKADTPNEILTFLSKCVFQGIEINVPATEFAFEDIISYPWKIRSIKFEENGRISPQFAISLLNSCPNVTDMTWKGAISLLEIGDHSIPEETNGLIPYYKLKNLTFNNARSVVQEDFNMQYRILDLIDAPLLKVAKFQLFQRYAKDNEVAQVLKFWIRHPNTETMLIDVYNNQNHLEVLTSTLTCRDKYFLQLIQTKHLEIRVNWFAELNKERQWVAIINCLNKVEHLKLDIQYLHHVWGSYDQDYPLTANPENLKSFHLAARFDNARFMYFPSERCNKLKVLIVRNATLRMAMPPATFQAFGSSTFLDENLEVLILTDFRLSPELFNAIKRFKKLKHLGLLGLDQFGRFDGTVSFQQFVQIFQIRSLEALLIPIAVANAVEEAAFRNFISTLLPFVSANQGLIGKERGYLYNIADPNNCPFWTVIDCPVRGNGYIHVGPQDNYVYQ